MPVNHSKGSYKVKTGGGQGTKPSQMVGIANFQRRVAQQNETGLGSCLPRKILLSGDKSEIKQDKIIYPGHLSFNHTVSPGKQLR